MAVAGAAAVTVAVVAVATAVACYRQRSEKIAVVLGMHLPVTTTAQQ